MMKELGGVPVSSMGPESTGPEPTEPESIVAESLLTIRWVRLSQRIGTEARPV